MKRAVTASAMALILSVSLIEPAWAFDRETKLAHKALSGDRMRLLVTLALLASQNPPDECKNDAPVVIQRRRSGRWVKFASGRTNQRGRFSITRKRRSGSYRARAKRFMTSSGFECFSSTSTTVRVP